jgi:hypothetical protein
MFNDFVRITDINSVLVLTLAILDDWMEMRGFDAFVWLRLFFGELA